MTVHVPAFVPVRTVPEIEQYPDPEATAYVTAPVPLPPEEDKLIVDPTLTLLALGTAIRALCEIFAAADVMNVRELDNAVEELPTASTRQ